MSSIIARRRTIRVRLMPAAKVSPSLMPRIPTWWPLPDRDRPDETQADRDRKRLVRAFTEAVTGPFDQDGRVHQVELDGDDPPPVYLPAPGFTYRFEQVERGGRVARYRYWPEMSTRHRDAMRAVEDAFAQASPAYAERARTTDPEAIETARSAARELSG